MRLVPPRRMQPSAELQKFQVLHAVPSAAANSQHAAQQSSIVGSRLPSPFTSILLGCAQSPPLHQTMHCFHLALSLGPKTGRRQHRSL